MLLLNSLTQLRCHSLVKQNIDLEFVFLFLFWFLLYRHFPSFIKFFFSFFFTTLLDYNCFTMLCSFLLCNKVNQLYAYTYPHVPSLLSLPPTLPMPPLQVVTKHRADLPVLCGCFPLAICFTFGSVYMSMPLSHFVPAYPSPSPCPQVHSLHLCLYSCPAPRFISTVFLDSMYMCQHTVFNFSFEPFHITILPFKATSSTPFIDSHHVDDSRFQASFYDVTESAVPLSRM